MKSENLRFVFVILSPGASFYPAKTPELVLTLGLTGPSYAIVKHEFGQPFLPPAVSALLSSANMVLNVSRHAVCRNYTVYEVTIVVDNINACFMIIGVGRGVGQGAHVALAAQPKLSGRNFCTRVTTPSSPLAGDCLRAQENVKWTPEDQKVSFYVV